jgi:integrase
MIIDPIDLADRLAELLKAKNQNETYVVRKQHRKTVVEAEILLRGLFEFPKKVYIKPEPLTDDEVEEIIRQQDWFSMSWVDMVRRIEERILK